MNLMLNMIKELKILATETLSLQRTDRKRGIETLCSLWLCDKKRSTRRLQVLRSLAVTAVLLCLAAPLAAQQPIDRIAAVVGNEIILASDLNTVLMQWSIQNQTNIFQNPEQMKLMSKDILEQMVTEKLLLIKAKEDTITADPERVDQYLDQQIGTFIQQVGSSEKLEEYYGMPLAQIKKELRKQIENRFVIDRLRQTRFSGTKITRREVENFYKQYADSLPKMEATVNISHILLQVKPNPSSADAAYARILEVQKQLENGADFTYLAKQYSEDPSAATNNGDLGWVNRGDFVPEFETAAYALENAGDISDIVQTQFGFHIIQLVERQGDKIHVRHILIQLQPTEDDARRVVERLQEIRRKILAGEATFEEMALENSDDPNVKQDKGNLGDFAVGNFQVKAFEEAVNQLNVGEISQPFKTDFGYHILKLNQRKEAHPLSLEKDWDQVEQYAVDFKNRQKFDKWLKELRAEIPIDIKIEI